MTKQGGNKRDQPFLYKVRFPSLVIFNLELTVGLSETFSGACCCLKYFIPNPAHTPPSPSQVLFLYKTVALLTFSQCLQPRTVGTVSGVQRQVDGGLDYPTASWE